MYYLSLIDAFAPRLLWLKCSLFFFFTLSRTTCASDFQLKLYQNNIFFIFYFYIKIIQKHKEKFINLIFFLNDKQFKKLFKNHIVMQK
jgi:hypothetical protein